MSQFKDKINGLNLTENIAIAALSQIAALKLEPSPEMYGIWYSYFKQDNQDLISAVDNIVKENPRPQQESFSGILNKWRQNDRQERKYQHSVSEVVSDTLKNAQNISKNTGEFNNAVSEFMNSEKEISPEMIEHLFESSRQTLALNQELLQKLEETQAKMKIVTRDYEVMKRELITDSLTGVYNRRHFDQELPLALQETEESKAPCCLLIVDIDHFKKFNDTWGHHIGDTVLRFVAQTVAKCFEVKDVVCRYGGEEFAVLMPYTSKSDAKKLAIKLCNIISKKEMYNKVTGESLGHITLSIGVSEKTKRETVQEWFIRTDEALYAAKKGGRNQVQTAA